MLSNVNQRIVTNNMTFKAKAPKDSMNPSYLHEDENKNRAISERPELKYRTIEEEVGNARPREVRPRDDNARPLRPTQAKKFFRPSSVCKP